MQLTFFGAARTVTGSKHLITTARGKKILLDCGLFQNKGGDNQDVNRHFGFDPSEIDALILSHAHIDHSGNIPHLVHQGFSGTIYATPATVDLCQIMLADSAHIQESDTAYLNRKRAKNGSRPLSPLYSIEDVYQAMRQFVAVPLNEWNVIDQHIRFLLTEAGHILGSAAVSIVFDEPEGERKVFFSGDTGRSGDIILPPPAPFPQADILITESTYGDRLHESVHDAEQHLLRVVKETCVDRRGKLIIPAFSLGRTQELVYTLNRLHNSGELPHIPVYVDSPLAISATAIMQKHRNTFNPEIIEYMKKDEDPFGFDKLVYVRDADSSKALNTLEEPCIIISASGMLEAGRIKHHIKNTIGDRKNTILIVGFVPPGSLGARLIEGQPEVRIFGKMHTVKARVEVLDAYSAHADYKELMDYLSCQQPHLVSRVFLVHGEEKALLAFKNRLHGKGFSDIVIPTQGESFYI
ncbi:MAG: MBL fold metallo-hydrolase [Sphingobacteriales bacterium]|nr:MBL fold metallo-hydrolase [Sphingobacteriales bacterium]